MPITVSCDCGKIFNVKDELAGTGVACKMCGKTVQVPGSENGLKTHIEQEPPPSPEEVPAMTTSGRICHMCAEAVPDDAGTCPFCKSSLKKCFSKEQLKIFLEAAVAKLDQQENGDKSGILTTKTIVLGCINVLLLATTTIAIDKSSDPGFAVMGGLGILTLLIFGISFLVTISNDFATRTGKKDLSPNKVFTAFLKSIFTNRTDRAFMRLIPSAKNNPSPDLPDLKKVQKPKGEFSISDEKSLKKYWASFTYASLSYARMANIKKVKVTAQNDRYAIVEADLKLTSYPTIILVTALFGLLAAVILVLIVQKEETVKLRKLLIKGNEGRWYVAESEFSGVLDQIEI